MPNTPTIKDIRAAAAARRHHRERRRRAVMAGAILLVLGIVASWWVLPIVLRQQLIKRGSEFLDRPVAVERVRFNPLVLAVTIENLHVADHDGEELLAWNRLRVDAKFWSTVFGNWAADAVELEGLRGRLVINADGVLNIDDLLETGEGEAGEEAPSSRPIIIDQLTVVDAQLGLTDHSRVRPFATQVGPLSFAVAHFHTKYDPEAPYDFSATTEAGEGLSWRGTLSLLPLRSTGEFELREVQVPKYAAYYAEHLPFEIESARLGMTGSYELVWTDDEQTLKLPRGEVSLHDVVLMAADGGPGRQSLTALEISGLSADLLAREAHVERLSIRDGDVELHRTAAGMAWLGVVLVSEEAKSESAVAQAGSLKAASIDEVLFEQIAYRWHDETLPVPTTIGLTLDRLRLDGVNLTDWSQPMGVDVALSFAEGGSLAVTGDLGLEPWTPALAIDLQGMNLSPATGYLQEATEHVLHSGTLSATGNWQVGEAGEGWIGDIEVSELALHDPAGREVAGWGQLVLTGGQIIRESLRAQIDAVALRGPRLRLRRDADGIINARPPEVAELTLDEPAIPATLPQIEVGSIAVAGGRVVWHDEMPPLPVTLSIDELAGEMSGWSSREVAKAQVELTGKVNGVAPWQMSGDLNPLGQPAHADLTITMDRADLLATDGYMRQYAGFDLQEGRLSLDIDFQLRQRTIESETVTTLDQFTLGDKFDSPDATKMPVKLAVALLKDPQGQVVVDVPVAGSLDDPEFRWGRVFWRVIGNILVKAATSPFALLGAAAGGGDEVDLEHHVFAPGEAMVGETTQASLDAVYAALQQRPALKIGVRGEYESERDAEVLRTLVLEQRLRELTGEDGPGSEGRWLPNERAAALVNYYETVFGEPPLDPDGVLPAPPLSEETEPVVEPVVAPEPEPEQGNLFVWLRRMLSGPPVEQPVVEPVPPAMSEELSFAVLEGVVPELAALPIEEVERRLLEQVTVDVGMLRVLATARAQAVQDYLLAAGLPAERMVWVEPSAGAVQVTLDLR